MSVFLEGQSDPIAVQTALKSENIVMALLLELQFVSGTVYVSNENVPYTDATGRTWQGFGDLVSMTEISGGSDNLSPLRKYQLGIPWSLLDDEERQIVGMGRIPSLIGNRSDYTDRAAILSGQLFELGDGLRQEIGDPFVLDTGLMDSVKIKYTPSHAAIELTVESALARKGAPQYGFLTYQDQRRRHSTDEGLQFVPEVVSTEVDWTEW